MPWILIKNNLKLMLRSRWILCMMIIMPLVTIALLSNAFRSMMNTTYTIQEFKVGYRLNENTSYKPMMKGLQEACKEKDIILEEYPQGEIRELLQNRTVAVFVDIQKNNTYTIYQSNESKTEAAVTDSIFSGFFYQLAEEITVQKESEKGNVESSNLREHYAVKQENLPINPVPTADIYYGIIYIVYFAWCGLVSLVAVITSERKSAIPNRMKITQMTKFGQYLAKFIPCSLTIFIQTCMSWMLSELLFDIKWGNIGLSIFIVALISMASSALGILLFQLLPNVAISIVVGFIITWVWGYFGGSFQSYMYLDLPKELIHSSPIYYINRTLVEFSTMGRSDYTGITAIYLVSIIVLCSLGGMLFIHRRAQE